jgi:putative alpha-1,2-mannosidase
MIMESMYGPNADGLCGNDDAGQMSAWYIFSALGFYPVCPGSEYYSIGSPLVTEATIHLDNGKTLKITARNQSPGSVYIESVSLNGRKIEGFLVSHHDLMKGGELLYQLSEETTND